MKSNLSTTIFFGAFLANSLVGYHALATEPLQIDIKYIYRHTTDDQFQTLTEGSTLYSGDTALLAPPDKREKINSKKTDANARKSLAANKERIGRAANNTPVTIAGRVRPYWGMM